ncbi:MAG: hypothetical protein ACYTKD_30145, partial [Planctomycetota bacterium]
GAEWHRFSQATAAGGKQFLYDGDNVLADIASGVDAFYVTPFLDQNLSITKDSATYYYSQDGLGSVRTLTDSSGDLKNNYDYLPFGGPHQPGTNVTVEQRYGHRGREAATKSSLQFYRTRWMAPQLGIMLRRNPWGYIQGRASLYDAFKQNPLRYREPYSWLAMDEFVAEHGAPGAPYGGGEPPTPPPGTTIGVGTPPPGPSEPDRYGDAKCCCPSGEWTGSGSYWMAHGIIGGAICASGTYECTEEPYCEALVEGCDFFWGAGLAAGTMWIDFPPISGAYTEYGLLGHTLVAADILYGFSAGAGLVGVGGAATDAEPGQVDITVSGGLGIPTGVSPHASDPGLPFGGVSVGYEFGGEPGGLHGNPELGGGATPGIPGVELPLLGGSFQAFTEYEVIVETSKCIFAGFRQRY